MATVATLEGNTRKSASDTVQRKKKKRKHSSEHAAEVYPARHASVASPTNTPSPEPAVHKRPVPAASPASAANGAENVELGARVLNTSFCATDLASDDELVLLRVPADIDPAALDGSSVAWPHAPGQAVALNDADGFELVREAARSHSRTYLLGARDGAVSAAPMAACCSIRWRLDAHTASEDEVDPAWLKAADERADGASEPRWVKSKSRSVAGKSGAGAHSAQDEPVQRKDKKKKAKRRQKIEEREPVDTEAVAAAVMDETEAAMDEALREKKRRKKDKRKRRAAVESGSQA